MASDPCGGDVPGGDGCRCDPPFVAAGLDDLRPYLEAVQDAVREIAAATKTPVWGGGVYCEASG